MYKKIIALVSVVVMVFLCSFPVLANDHADSYQINAINNLTTDSKVRYQINSSVLHMQRENTYVVNNQTYTSYETEVLVTILLVSQTTQYDAYCDNTWNFQLYYDAKQNLGTVGGITEYSPYKITSVTPLSDNNFGIVNLVGADANGYTFAIFPNPQYTCPTTGSRFVVPRGQTLVMQFKFTVSGYRSVGGVTGQTDQYFIPTTVTQNIGQSTWTYGNYPIQASYYTLYNQTNGYEETSPHSADLQNDSDGLTTQSDNVHTQETGYYTQTNTALNNTGLSNYSFSADEIGGINLVKGHFMRIWNILDDYKNVYIFSMTLSLALMIIRHIRPIKRKKEDG